VERRYAVFIALSLAAVLGSQVMRTILFPQADKAPPIADTAAGNGDIATQDKAAKQNKLDITESTHASSTESGRAVGDQSVGGPAGEVDSKTDRSASPSSPRRHLSLGSLQPDGPAGMLVTLSSRGASVERIELAGEQFTIRMIAGHTSVTLQQMLFLRGADSASSVMVLQQRMLG
jgi:hypothetical protein